MLTRLSPVKTLNLERGTHGQAGTQIDTDTGGAERHGATQAGGAGIPSAKAARQTRQGAVRMNTETPFETWAAHQGVQMTPVDVTDPVYFAGNLAVAVVKNQAQQCLTQPDWWQAVLLSLHDMLADTYLREDDSCDGDRYLTRVEQRTLANWLEHQAQQYRVNR